MEVSGIDVPRPARNAFKLAQDAIAEIHTAVVAKQASRRDDARRTNARARACALATLSQAF